MSCLRAAAYCAGLPPPLITDSLCWHAPSSSARSKLVYWRFFLSSLPRALTQARGASDEAIAAPQATKCFPLASSSCSPPPRPSSRRRCPPRRARPGRCGAAAFARGCSLTRERRFPEPGRRRPRRPFRGQRSRSGCETKRWAATAGSAAASAATPAARNVVGKISDHTARCEAARRQTRDRAPPGAGRRGAAQSSTYRAPGRGNRTESTLVRF